MRTLDFKLTNDNPSETIELKDDEKFFIIKSITKDLKILQRYIKDSDNIEDEYRKIVLEKPDNIDYVFIQVVMIP